MEQPGEALAWNNGNLWFRPSVFLQHRVKSSLFEDSPWHNAGTWMGANGEGWWKATKGFLGSISGKCYLEVGYVKQSFFGGIRKSIECPMEAYTRSVLHNLNFVLYAFPETHIPHPNITFASVPSRVLHSAQNTLSPPFLCFQTIHLLRP